MIILFYFDTHINLSKQQCKLFTEKNKSTIEKLEEELEESKQVIENHELTIDYLQKRCNGYENNQKNNMLQQQKLKDDEVII